MSLWTQAETIDDSDGSGDAWTPIGSEDFCSGSDK
jgi:hypothetical protein